MLFRKLSVKNGELQKNDSMCNLYSITTNQAAIAALFRVVNRYVGNLAPMPGVFPDYPAPVIRNSDSGTEVAMMRWGMPPPPRTGGPPERLAALASCVQPKRSPRMSNLRPATGGNRLPVLAK